MRKLFAALALVALGTSSPAQFGPRGPSGVSPGPKLTGSMAAMFGENSAFSATLEMQSKGKSPESVMIIPGRIAFADGKSRFEMDMSEAKGGSIQPGTAAQMKAMGMDKMVSITRPDKKATYLVYPGLHGFVEAPIYDKDATKSREDFTVETKELGRETVDGHECVKNQTVVSDKEGNRHEATVWNATDLKKFPVKIEQMENGSLSTLLFKDVKLSKPDESQFDPPSDLKKYDNLQALMQDQMLKRFSGGQGIPNTPEKP